MARNKVLDQTRRFTESEKCGIQREERIEEMPPEAVERLIANQPSPERRAAVREAWERFVQHCDPRERRIF